MITTKEVIKEVRKGYITSKEERDYFNGHIERFVLSIDAFSKYLSGANIRSVADIGTVVPFASLFFNMSNGAEIKCFSLVDDPGVSFDENISYARLNINKPEDIGKFDLVICTECLEHIPSSMDKALRWLYSCVNDGGYLFISCPCGGLNACDYDKELTRYDWNVVHPHIREFTHASADAFIGQLNAKVIWTGSARTGLYQADIKHYLLQKEREPQMVTKTSTYKCPKCGKEVNATPAIRVSCINCNVPLVEVKKGVVTK